MRNQRYFRVLAVVAVGILILFSYMALSTKKGSIENLNTNSVLVPENFSGGYILYNGKLINEFGNIIHEWKKSRLGVILPDGSYIAKSFGEERKIWGRYTWNDTAIWESEVLLPNHMISITPRDTILTITKELHEYEGESVWFDVILEYDLEFNLLDKWSTWDNQEKIEPYYKEDLRHPKDVVMRQFTYYHMNSIREVGKNENSEYEIIENNKTIRPFQEGNWIMSFRKGSMVLILDKDTREIVWHAVGKDVDGEIQAQHDSTMLPNGNIQIFDNGLYRNQSRVIELDPISMEIIWEYTDSDFFTSSRGGVQLLPNGNRLITESNDGRIFEIDSNKEIVWEYFSSQNENNSDKRVRIIHMKKYSKNFINQIIEDIERL